MQTLSYSQCCKLKEIGFPQDTCSMTVSDQDRVYNGHIKSGCPDCPTVDELIEWLAIEVINVWCNETGSSRFVVQGELKEDGGWGVITDAPRLIDALYEFALKVKGTP